MKFTINQESKIITQGDQRLINISKKFHESLVDKNLLKKDLKITIILDDDVESS